jgi:hypothetical protein
MTRATRWQGVALAGKETANALAAEVAAGDSERISHSDII